jgi:drug/metabolite transporter (DMT)-like permease
MKAGSASFRPRDTAWLLVLALIWGNSFFFIKTAVAVVPPLWIVTLRMALGAVLLWVLARVTGQAAAWNWPDFFKMGLVGIFGSALPWAGQAWAQRALDSGLMSVLNASTPVATLLLALGLRQERLYANRVFGLALAVVGTLLVVGVEVRAGRSTLALAAGVLSTFGYAVAAVLTRLYVSGRISNIWAATWQLSWGAALLTPWAWLTEGPPPTSLEPGVLGALGALGLLGTGAAFLIYFWLLQRVGATNTSMVTYLVPVVGLSSGALFRGERFGANVFLGALAMISGVWLAQRAPRPRPHVDPTSS